MYHLTGKIDYGAEQSKTLKAIVDEAPYFAPARFLFTAALKQTYPYEQWMLHARTTNLYFTNPGWLQWQLEEVESKPFRAARTILPQPVETTTPHIAEEQEVTVEEAAPVHTHTDDSINTGTIVEIAEAAAEENTFKPTVFAASADAKETEEDTVDDEAPLETTEADSKISGILSSQLADFKKPVDESATLDIDADRKPMHTIDYFVSQGIKVDLSAVPQDKLTTHLLKFTDWLKQVKHAQNPNTCRDLGTTLEMEKAVAETAKNSNETREVVTESMADVLVKQGQVEKAIQLYIKLSFINPEKSSYFAAKIEQLKGI